MKKLYYLSTALFLVGAVMLTSCEPSGLNEVDNTVAGVEPPDVDCSIDHRTQTPGGWGSPANGNNPGTIRDAYFDAAFPNGLEIGCRNGGYTVTFTSAQAVEDFLPSGGKSKALTMDYVDPDNKDLKNTLAGQIVALKLSTEIDHYLADFGASEFLLCDLVICEGEFEGKTVEQILRQANHVLGGCESRLTIQQAVDMMTSINENFVDGTTDNGYLCCKASKSTSNSDETI